MNVADSARTGVIVLRVIAAVVVAATVIGNFLITFGRNDDGSSLFDDSTTDRFTVGQFLGSVATPLAIAGIVFGMSFMLAVAAARLDLDIVLADEQETADIDQSDDT